MAQHKGTRFAKIGGSPSLRLARANYLRAGRKMGVYKTAPFSMKRKNVALRSSASADFGDFNAKHPRGYRGRFRNK